MKFKAYINVMPLEEILDPKGKATQGGLHNMGYAGVQDVRIGKRIRLLLEADSADQARAMAEEASSKLLANRIMESYEVEVLPA